MAENRSFTKGNYERALWLDAQIREGAYPSVRSLAEEFEKTERTAHRDVLFLKENLGAPIKYDRQKKGYYYSEISFRLPTVMMSQGELLAICLAKNLLAQYKDAPFVKTLQTAFEKICRALPDTVSVDLDAVSRAISFELEPSRDINPQMYDILLEAIHSKRRLRIHYYTASRGAYTQREVDSYKLYNHQYNWYLIAFDHMRKELRDFALNRIQEAQLLDQTFELSPKVDLETHLKNHFGGIRSNTPIPVSVLFDEYQARWIRETVWTGETGREEHMDGSLTLHLTVYDLDSAKRWVMQYGAHARVLQPQELVQRVEEEVILMNQHYQDKEGDTQ